MPARLTHEDFITRAQCVHQLKYDYSKSVYINKQIPIIITCPLHGEFEQSAQEHIDKKRGCRKCAHIDKIKTNEWFLTKANLIHNNKYEYLDEYVSSKTKIRIVCPIHGVFEQHPSGHLSTTGCSKCVNMGYINDMYFRLHPDKVNIPACLYFLRIIVPSGEEYLKIGISTKNAKSRVSNLKFYDIISYIIYEKFSTFYSVYTIEQHLLNRFAKYRVYLNDEKFGGKNECFDFLHFDEIFNYYKGFINETK